jgi:LPXTG-site transpeptidase (sortase) family protein
VSRSLPVFDPCDGADATPRPGGRPRRYAGAAGRALDLFGELLLTFGLLCGLYLVYLLWWTNVSAGLANRADSAAFQHTLAAAPAAAPSDTLTDGTPFGFLYIPALGPGWRALIAQGTERAQVLNSGAVGHYSSPATAMPWDARGNFAIAGHRDGHGMIFRDLDRLRPGDRVYVQTLYGWFVYRLDREAPALPIDDVGVLAPVPVGSGYTAAGRYLTMTTCTPMYVDSRRLVWWGTLVATAPRGTVPAGLPQGQPG